MRRILLIALLGTAVVALLSSTAAAKPKPATFKVGAYKAKAKVGSTTPFKITLKRAKCGGKLQFCVALPTSPTVTCTGPLSEEPSVGNFATPVALPSSGKVTEHAPLTGAPPFPGATAPTGQSAFSVTFTKNGTASGFLEVSLASLVQGQALACTGKASFTAKLG
jgi:hypothetical protein